jgi:3-dehydroquinate synthase
MVASLVSDRLVVQSHAGPYEVRFEPGAIARVLETVPPKAHFIIDSRVAELYRTELAAVLGAPSVLPIAADEGAKSLDRFPAYIEHLVDRGVRRGHALVAIGGGVIQDITCFVAATLLRGLDWWFYPTTLLAQADSCIGSKSSINVGRAKNILGTFTPPRRIVVDNGVLKTLKRQEIRSGYGEMLKVHAIAGPQAFDDIARDYKALDDDEVRQHYIRRSLEIKRGIIEQYELDRTVRRVMNYGHTFGHAIESATDFSVPHGIAVTIGVDMANYVAMSIGRMSASGYQRMHPTLRANYDGFERVPVPLGRFMDAITKDKKNSDRGLTLILPDQDDRIAPCSHPNDSRFREICADYLKRRRAR